MRKLLSFLIYLASFLISETIAEARQTECFFVNSTVLDCAGAGTPEGAISAPIGSIFRRSDGGAGTAVYIKESGSGNTGWRAVGVFPTGSGTADRLVRWTASSTVANSLFRDNGTNLSAGGAVSTDALFRITGSFTGTANSMLYFQDGTSNGVANQNIYATWFAPELVEAASGTHPLVAAFRLNGVLTGGGGASTDTTQLWIPNAMTGGTNNYSIKIDAGTMKMGGLFDLTSGQIKFPSTQVPSADANTVDDFKRAAFTPAMTFNASATGVTYATQVGYYQKDGAKVDFSVTIVLTNNGTGVGSARIASLPYTSSSTANLFSSITCGFYANLSAATGITGYVENNATTALLQIPGAAATITATDTNIPDTSSLRCSGTYFAVQ